MPNTVFDGDFRSKPQQNFAGVNRNVSYHFTICDCIKIIVTYFILNLI